MTANMAKFGIHQSAAFKHIHLVCETINLILGPKLLTVSLAAYVLDMKASFRL